MNNKERSILMGWIQEHRCCAVCHWPESDGRRGLHVHHMEGGYARSAGHKLFNYLRLCSRCHDIFHAGRISGLSPELDRSTLLTAKKESDPKHYSPISLARLKHHQSYRYKRKPIPAYYLAERTRNLWPTRSP